MLAMENKDYPTAFSEVMRTDSLVSEKFSMAMGQNLGTAAYSYKEAESALHYYELKLSRIKLMIMVGISLFLLLSILSLLTLYRHKRHTYKTILKDWEAKVARLMATQDNSKLRENEQLISQMFNNKVKLIHQLRNSSSTQESMEDHDELNRQASLIIQELRDKPEELEREVNHFFNNIMANFRKDLPGMKEDNYLLFLYSVIGTPVDAIMVMMNNTRRQVYSRRLRIKEKISQLPPEKQELYFSILG